MKETNKKALESRNSVEEYAEILVIQPDIQGSLARFGEYFGQAGIGVTLIRPFLGERIPSRLEADGLVVLGGRMNAYAEDVYPWLKDIKELYRRADDGGIPTLGICLGAQILAVTFGGHVAVGSNAGPEIGVVEINWSEAARRDELVGGLPTPFLSGAFHHDGIIQLPRNAVQLGIGKKYPNQAFRLRRAVGVQFHPEVTSEEFSKWLAADMLKPSSSVNQLQKELHEFEHLDPTIAQHTEALAANFVEVVRESQNSRQMGYSSLPLD